MKCKNCGSVVGSGLLFCEDCGNPVKAETPKKPSAGAAKPEALDSSRTAHLSLQVWKPFRWLVASPYGDLKISQDHIEFDIRVDWKLSALKGLVMLFSWGFDVLSWLRAKGTSQLKNVSTAKVISVDWLFWRANILVIASAGYTGIYGFAGSQLPVVEAFLHQLKQASVEAKYKTVG